MLKNPLKLSLIGTLAAILLVVGYKLAKPALFKKMYAEGKEQFLPFVITVLGIVFIDLLWGIALGMVIAIFMILLRNNFKIPYKIEKEQTGDKEKLKITLPKDVTFLKKAAIQNSLSSIKDGTIVEVDASQSELIHPDVTEIFEDFQINAKTRNIQVNIIGSIKK